MNGHRAKQIRKEVVATLQRLMPSNWQQFYRQTYRRAKKRWTRRGQ